MDSRKETVRKAIAIQNPERIPLLYAKSLEKSDIINIPVVRHFIGPDKNVSEWGFTWMHLDNELLMGQPDINGIEEMGKRFGGRICFSCPVSYQTTGITGTDDEIKRQIELYKKHFNRGGGLIGIIPEDSAALGITPEKFKVMEEAFMAK